jgi:hypothetical protein
VIEPPYLIEAGTLVSVGNRDHANRFCIGDVLSFNAMEFSRICWTQFTCALSCAQLAESWGRAKGFEFGAVAAQRHVAADGSASASLRRNGC